MDSKHIKKAGAHLYWAIRNNRVPNIRKRKIELDKLFGDRTPENPFE